MNALPRSDAPNGSPGNRREVLLAFLRLGLTSFGGPVAHLGYFRDELVVRRRPFRATKERRVPPCFTRIPVVLSILLGLSARALAETNLDLQYTITAAKISVGQLTASVALRDTEYSINGDAKIRGAARFLSNGEGSSVVHGTLTDGQLTPNTLETKSTFPGDPPFLRVEFENGRVKKREVPALPNDRIPLAEDHLVNVIDPLTALLIKRAEPLDQTCNDRLLPIFDGFMRYNIKLSFKKLDKNNDAPSFAGAALICNARFFPIAGHDASNPVIRLFADREIETALVPVADTYLIPYRITISTMLANLVIRATRLHIAPPEQ
jgi:uncharacterized protein DUF3108